MAWTGKESHAEGGDDCFGLLNRLATAFVQIDEFKHRLNGTCRQGDLRQAFVQPLRPGIEPCFPLVEASETATSWVTNTVRRRRS